MEIFLDGKNLKRDQEIEIFMSLSDLSIVIKSLQQAGRSTVDEGRKWTFLRVKQLNASDVDFVTGTSLCATDEVKTP